MLTLSFGRRKGQCQGRARRRREQALGCRDSGVADESRGPAAEDRLRSQACDEVFRENAQGRSGRAGGVPPDAEKKVAMAASLNRRRFLDSLLGTAFASTIVAVVYPVWRYLIPPQSGEPATQSVVAAQASQVKANSGMIFKFGTKPGLLVRAPDGTLHAYNAVCTHLECTVQYKSDT